MKDLMPTGQVETYEAKVTPSVALPYRLENPPSVERDSGGAQRMSKWNEKPLGTLCSIKTGKKDVNEGSSEGKYPFFTCSRDVHASDSYSFDTDAILIAGNGAVGDTKLYRGKFEAYQRTYVLDGFEEDLDFIFYVLKASLSEALKKVVSGSTMPYIRKGDLERYPIPLPPLPEQKKIAHILSTVQRAIEAQVRIIQTTSELKKALMHKLFTEGLRNEPQKETEIGLVPESWEILPISELFETQLGKMLSQKAKIGNSPNVYLRNKNVQWGRIDTEDLLRMDFNDREAEKFQLRKGDLLVCEGGEVGRAALWDGSIADCYYQKALHRLRPKTDRITNEFMVHWMMYAFLLTNTYGVTGTRTTIAHLPEIKLKPLLVPVPSPDEQAEIIAVIDAVYQKNAGHQRKLGELQNLFRTLLHELMTAKTCINALTFSAMK